MATKPPTSLGYVKSCQWSLDFRGHLNKIYRVTHALSMAVGPVLRVRLWTYESMNIYEPWKMLPISFHWLVNGYLMLSILWVAIIPSTPVRHTSYISLYINQSTGICLMADRARLCIWAVFCIFTCWGPSGALSKRHNSAGMGMDGVYQLVWL